MDTLELQLSPVKHTETSLFRLLCATYEGEAYTVLPQVRNSTGHNQVTRTADAIVASLWPSRGIWCGGYEIKCSRSDWLNEVKDPSKANEIARHLHSWTVIIADESMVKPGELPAAWGLMVPSKKGDKLRTIKEATHRKDAAPEWNFVASILRNVAGGMVPKSLIESELRKGREKLEASVAERIRYQANQAKEEAERTAKHLQTSIDKFEATTGMRIRDYAGYTWRGDNRKAVELITSGGLEAQKRALTDLSSQALLIAELVKTIMSTPQPEPDFSI
jgi:hypothetical protein